MKAYENDNELIYMIWQKDDLALRLLMSKYQTVIDCKIAEVIYDKRVFRQLREELRQCGYIMLHSCLENYNMAKNVKFATFFSFCFERKIRNQLRSYYNGGGRIQSMISLDQTVDEFGEFTLGENIESYYPDYQAESLLNYHELVRLVARAISDFSDQEKDICNLRQKGYGYEEIVEAVGCNYKKVDNTMQKFRKAVKENLRLYN